MAFIFDLLQYSPIQAFTSCFVTPIQLYCQRHKTAHMLQWRFLRLYQLNRRKYQTDTNSYNTACDTLEHITAPHCLQCIPDTSSAQDAVQFSTAAYYNEVYKMVQHTADHASLAGASPTVCESLASAAPCAPAEVSASPPAQAQPGGGINASHARRLAVWHRSAWHPPPGGAVQRQGHGRRRGTIGGYHRISFRAFAR